MKDLVTEVVLLEGRVREGLYELPLQWGTSRVVLNCERLPHYLWHCCLSHLNSKYMSILLKMG